jgi:hypothetical protein
MRSATSTATFSARTNISSDVNLHSFLRAAIINEGVDFFLKKGAPVMNYSRIRSYLAPTVDLCCALALLVCYRHLPFVDIS